MGRVKCPTVWQPEDKQAKIIINTESSGLTEEVVPAANHFVLEINHFNKVITFGYSLPNYQMRMHFGTQKHLKVLNKVLKKIAGSIFE